MKFRRKKIDPHTGQFYPHPEGCAGIGIHALRTDMWLTIEQIKQEHEDYFKIYEGVPPTYGELIRDLGLFVCFNMVEVSTEDI